MTAAEISLGVWFAIICVLILISYVRVVVMGMGLLRRLGYPRWLAIVPPVVWLVSAWSWLRERWAAS